MKNKKNIIIILVVLILVLAISLGIFAYAKHINSLPLKYICISDTATEKRQTIIKYEATLDENNNITYFYGEKKYIYHNDTNYYNALYSTSIRDVKYINSKEELSITIYIADGEIINENGEVIYPNYLEYMSTYINDKYECKLVRQK